MSEPTGKRQKLQLPKKSWKEADDDGGEPRKRSERALEDWFAPLYAATKQRATCAQAEWLPDVGLAVVTVQKGAALNGIGKIHRSRLALHVEEALWLVDKGALQLFFNDALLSIQQCYGLLDSTGTSLSRFLAYAHLKRAGFIPLRHDPTRWNSADQSSPSQSSTSQSIQPASVTQSIQLTDEEQVLQSRNWWPATSSWLSAVGDDSDGVVTLSRTRDSLPVPPSNDAAISRQFLSESSTAQCLAALRQLGPSDAAEERPSGGLTVHYDVYRARKGFRISAPGRPDFCLSVCRFDEAMPSIDDIADLMRRADGVSYRICIDSSGTLNFVHLHALVPDLVCPSE